jgi:hypothetical protein
MPLAEDEIEKVARIAELNSLDESDQPWAGRSLADLLTLTEYIKRFQIAAKRRPS